MKQIKDLAWMSAIALAGTITFAACSSDDDKVQNINPTYDGKSVKTQFAINIPRAAQTRQTADITQNNSIFRGMTDIKLIPLTGTATSESAINHIALGDITTEDTDYADGQKTYQDVDIATGTSHFLFYGKAIKEQAATNAQNGILESNLSTASTAGDITFSLDKIYDGDLIDASLLAILNNIVGITDWQNSVNASLQTALLDIEKLTAGSSNSILKAVEKLYNAIVGRADEHAEEGTTGYIANLIKVKIEKYFTPSSLSPYTLTYKASFEEDEGTITINQNFPIDKNLPEGAARLTCTDHVFTYTLTAIGSAETVSISSIAYPAELYYFANTPLKANTSADAYFDWTTGTWTGWTDEVAATTRLIALQNKINYGVALLNTTIKLSGTSLKDNKNTDITVSNQNSNLKFTGILIGGQPAKVGWNFEPTNGETFATTIYDNAMNSNDALSTTAITNYTMVLDNYGSKGVADNTSNAPNNSVNIAIELQNNTGVEFHGADGVVPNGGKFYLVAKLDPTSPKETIAGVDRVFLQDYTTTANLTITSLKNAYVTIPDLRATQLNLGLYVDLSWETGLTFDVNIGGGNY